MRRLVYLAGILASMALAGACTSSSDGGSSAPAIDITQAHSTATAIPTATLPATMPTPIVRATVSLTPVAPRTPTPSGQVAGQTTYVVQPGDTAYSIAEKFGITVNALASANNLEDPRLIRSGQKLVIPGR